MVDGFDIIEKIIKVIPEALADPVIRVQEEFNEGLRTVKGIADVTLEIKRIEYLKKVEEDRHKEMLCLARDCSEKIANLGEYYLLKDGHYDDCNDEED